MRLKRSLLRIEKNFVQDINEPLKKAMINKSKPNYPNLIEQATHYKQEIIAACETWREEAETVCTEIKGKYFHGDPHTHTHILEVAKAHVRVATQGWREASELYEKIEELVLQTRDRGWASWEDEEFLKLNPDNVFLRADGPNSVITYLEAVLARVK